MKIYLVGGAVRDKLLGLNIKDKDWVVVGTTPEAMIAKGYRPVGKDFPVFLHPDTHEEYALARTERKSGHGYSGFVFHTSPDISLEEDLIRRDLTINAMAQDQEGNIVDPYGGQSDLEDRKLRHVSSAFEEDPLRVLRIARFAARLNHADFTIAEETQTLMNRMVASGEVQHLVPERVWQETARALMEPSPEVYFNTLIECGALQVVMPVLSHLIKKDSLALRALEYAVSANESALIRFACLHPPIKTVSSEKLKAFHKQMRFPAAFSERAQLVHDFLPELTAAQKGVNAPELITLFEKTDAFRKPERFLDALASSFHLAEAAGEKLTISSRQKLEKQLKLCRSVDAKPIVDQGYKGKEIGRQLRLERIKRLEGHSSH